MAFNIRMGLPEMEALWNDLSTRKQQGKLDKEEEKFFKKLVKALSYLGRVNVKQPLDDEGEVYEGAEHLVELFKA